MSKMQPIANLVHAANASMKNSKISRNETSMPELSLAETATVMAKFSMRYLHKWDSAIDGREDDVVTEWAERLSGLSQEQIAHGLNAWTGDWPPTSEEFRKCCLGTGKNDFGLTHVPQYHRADCRITDRSRSLSSAKRDQSRAVIREKLAQLKAALGGDSSAQDQEGKKHD